MKTLILTAALILTFAATATAQQAVCTFTLATYDSKGQQVADTLFLPTVEERESVDNAVFAFRTTALNAELTLYRQTIQSHDIGVNTVPAQIAVVQPAYLGSPRIYFVFKVGGEQYTTEWISNGNFKRTLCP